MKIALLTTCPGRDEPLAPWSGGTPPCSVHGFARCIGADIWEGASTSQELYEALPGHDVVVMNCNTEMIRAAPAVAERMRGHDAKLALLQEGDARVWNGYEQEKFVAWLTAAGCANVLLIYNDEHAQEWEALTGTPTRYVPLPHPEDARQYRVPWSEREHAIFIGSGPVPGRGGIVSAALARAVSGTAAVYTRLAHYDDSNEQADSRKLAEAYDATVVPWRRRQGFLILLAKCRLAVNLDPLHSYGRFAADCAALAVPCVGLSSHRRQRDLWPALTVREDEDAAARLEDWAVALADPELFRRLAGRADGASAAQAPERVREAFQTALDAAF